MSADDLLVRVNAVEDRIRLLQEEVVALRGELEQRGAGTPPAAAPQPLRPRDPFPPSPVRAAAPAPPPPAAPRELDLAALLGPQALAWAGGIVTLLGVVFFFVLAVDNGWIGPVARVLCGALASALVCGGGVWLRRRFGETHAAVAAVGAGIAGAYATLAAATVLYHLVPRPLALVGAAAAAAAALAAATAWRTELLAALGLLGAIAAPSLLALDGGLTATGVTFAAFGTAAAAIVGVRLRWPWLLAGAVVASAPQIAALTADAGRLDAAAIALAAAFALLYLGTAVAEQAVTGSDALAPLPTFHVLASAGVTWLATAQLVAPAGGAAAGGALLVAGAVYGASAVAVWLHAQRELATLVGAVSLAAGAVGIAELLSGANLAYTFAGQAVVLAVAARRTREPRLQLGALGYLVLAGGHALVLDAPPESLFEAVRHPAAGAAALSATAVAALAVAALARGTWREDTERGVLAFVEPVIRTLREHQRELTIALVCAGGALVVDAVSLAVLELFQRGSSSGVVHAFHLGHVAVTALWAAAGLGAVCVASRRREETARLLAYLWLAATALKVACFDGPELHGALYASSFLATAGALLLAGYLGDVLEDRVALTSESGAAVLAAVAYAVVSLAPLDDDAQFGLALLGIASVLGVLAATVLSRRRDLATVLWAPGVPLALAAAPLLVHGTWLTLAWSAGAAALAGLAVATRESRFLAASLAATAAAVGAALVHAPPSHLFVAHAHPADGLIGLLLLAGALFALGWSLQAPFAEWRPVALWVNGALLVYATSLAILGVVVGLSTASLHTDFQRGHSGVSALWGALGLALLYVGLTRGRRALRLGGFAVFGVSLGKLFLYDLSQLSSVTRALSFLAVGGVLLVGGFFAQKLTAQPGQPDPNESPPAYS